MSPDFGRIAVQAAEDLTIRANGLGESVAELANAYRSPFYGWDHSASVRRRPRHRMDRASADTLHFPPELVAVYDHPLVAAKGARARRRILTLSLCQYLHFTTELEDLAVIPVAVQISRGRSGLDLPAAARRDAHKIVTDEAWHAQFSSDLLEQVLVESGEGEPYLPEPLFVERLAELNRRMRSHVPDLGKMLFAVVSETLISALLAQIPHDTRLPRAVRDTVADHARDEGRHHAYFKDILWRLWTQLTPSERSATGPWLPAIIMAFLEPDYRAIACQLAALDLNPDEVEAVLTESYPRSAVLAYASAAARQTIRYFDEVGARHDPATADAFAIFPSSEQ